MVNHRHRFLYSTTTTTINVYITTLLRHTGSIIQCRTHHHTTTTILFYLIITVLLLYYNTFIHAQNGKIYYYTFSYIIRARNSGAYIYKVLLWRKPMYIIHLCIRNSPSHQRDPDKCAPPYCFSFGSKLYTPYFCLITFWKQN